MLQELVETLTRAADPSSPPDEVTSVARLARIAEASGNTGRIIDKDAAPVGPQLDDATIVQLVRDWIAKGTTRVVSRGLQGQPLRHLHQGPSRTSS